MIGRAISAQKKAREGLRSDVTELVKPHGTVEVVLPDHQTRHLGLRPQQRRHQPSHARPHRLRDLIFDGGNRALEVFEDAGGIDCLSGVVL